MESERFGKKGDRLDFRQIVLGHLKQILEISSHELRDMTYTTNHSNFTETTYQEDTRLSYIQSIENLAYILIPYFDEKIQEVYDDCIAVLDGYSFDIKKWFNEEIENFKAETGRNEQDFSNAFVLNIRLRYAKILFRNLNLLLKRVDYLKSVVYGEDMGEEIVRDESDGDEE